MTTVGTGVGQFNFTLKQGADTTISMIWTDDSGQPVDLTNYQMALTVRAFVSSTVALVSLSSSVQSGSRIVLGGTAGTISLIFAHSDTGQFPVTGASPSSLSAGLPVYKLGVYDLQFTDPAGNVGYLLEGLVSLDPKVT